MPARAQAAKAGETVRRALPLSLLLAAITFIAYGRSWSNGFADYDDPDYVTKNLHVQAGLSRETVRWAFTTYTAGNWHPLTWLSHALDVQIFGLTASGHHFSSVVLHALNVVLLFLLLWKATGSRNRSLMVAALFAVHPLNVECVAWVAERKSLLSALFFLLALGAYGWYARLPSLKRYALLVLLFACGLMAKPMIVTLPFVLMLLDYWPLQRVEGWTSRSESADAAQVIRQRPPLHLVLEKLPLLAMAAASTAVTVLAQLHANAVVPFAHASMLDRVKNALCSYSLYLTQAAWPVNLGVFYPPFKATLLQELAALIFLIAISVWAWRNRRRRLYLIIGWLWYLGTLVPVIGLVQVGLQSMADRYAYIPLIGIFVMLVWLVGEATAIIPHSFRVQAAVAVAVVIALTALTIRQVGFWQNPITLWTHTLQVTHDNFVGEDNLALALTNAGRENDAIIHFENAIRIKPDEASAYIGIAYIFRERDPRRAIERAQHALSLTRDPKDLLAIYINLGVAYLQSGDYANASKAFQGVLALDSSNSAAMLGLGNALVLQAADRMTHEMDRHPTVDGFNQLGKLWEQAGYPERAKQAYASAQSLTANPPSLK